MSSKSKANSSPSERVLSQTLTHVRERRHRRRKAAVAVAIPAVILAAVFLRQEFTLPTNTPEIVESGEPEIRIQRIGREAEGRISRIERSSHLGKTERLAGVSPASIIILRINDGQLLAALPEGTIAGLLKDPDGTSRLLFFDDSVPKR